jgi:hypothetical protein
MNTNRRTLAQPYIQRRARYREMGKLFWAGATVFSGLLLAVLYCLVMQRLPA